ncbi:regulatory protein RecX [Geosporobacter ferrireducens]|uniref:Regulatory protein RecX n=1 Tax=Geosporobacter ferrireducens TaxID=1424294 RepID=A0A1D8GBC6_9FIRM|nr:regulatory protein RecX [Geosporobacter ferrireducens]AOT68217.1 hypothetical protein Gferi_00625 [Geosporobacter ferrireducens]MTI57365.1 regulatory protein RecX [Geosporobacter ferrireducens]
MEEFQEAYGKALNYLSYRSRTESEMTRYLIGKEYSEEVIRKVIERLIELNYLNDYEYARRYIEITGENKALSSDMIKIHLKQKGIPSEVIKDALNALEVDELEHCIRLLKKKVKENEYLSDNQQRIKLKSYLFRKGFRMEVIHKAIDLLHKEFSKG